VRHRILESAKSVNDLSRCSRQDGGRSRHPTFAIEQGKVMEIAAAVLFGSVVIWFLQEATGEHI